MVRGDESTACRETNPLSLAIVLEDKITATGATFHRPAELIVCLRQPASPKVVQIVITFIIIRRKGNIQPQPDLCSTF